MDLDYAFFADTATVPPDRKLYVLGGGFSAVTLPSLPGRVTFAVVAGFRFGAADAGRAHQVELRFLDANEKLVLPPQQMQFQSAGVPPDSDVEVTVPTVTYIAPMFGEAGRYTAEYWSDDRRLARVPLTVVEQAQPEIGARPN